jgi:hypothetical protein
VFKVLQAFKVRLVFKAQPAFKAKLELRALQESGVKPDYKGRPGPKDVAL